MAMVRRWRCGVLCMWLLGIACADSLPTVTIGKCSSFWDHSDWTVRGYCKVNITEYHGPYRCDWDHVKPDGSMQRIGSSQGHRSWGNDQCSFGDYNLTAAGISGAIRLNVSVGESGDTRAMPIQPPGELDITQCPQYLVEGSNLTCQCGYSGNPLPLVTWGQENPSPILRITNVARGLTKASHTCSQYWGSWSGWSGSSGATGSVEYRVRVFYPPDPPIILGAVNNTLEVPENGPATLSCTARGGDPELKADSLFMVCVPGRRGNESGLRSDESDVEVEGEDNAWKLNWTLPPVKASYNGSRCTCTAFTYIAGDSQLARELRADTLVTLVVVVATDGTANERPTIETTALDENDDDGFLVFIIICTTLGGVAVINVVITVVIIVCGKRRRGNEDDKEQVISMGQMESGGQTRGHDAGLQDDDDQDAVEDGDAYVNVPREGSSSSTTADRQGHLPHGRRRRDLQPDGPDANLYDDCMEIKPSGDVVTHNDTLYMNAGDAQMEACGPVSLYSGLRTSQMGNAPLYTALKK